MLILPLLFLALLSLLDGASIHHITPTQAFESTVHQVDPETGVPSNVLLLDVRSRAESYWDGVPARANNITLKNAGVLIPDDGRIQIVLRPYPCLGFTVSGTPHCANLSDVNALDLSPLSHSVPLRFWDEEHATLVPNSAFNSSVAALARTPPGALIAMCRSGVRAADSIEHLAPEVARLFSSFYTIDVPGSPNPGFGGFSGSSYKGIINGYAGFPGRDPVQILVPPSASWLDASLPIMTLVNPLTGKVDHLGLRLEG
jgi:hypothetical protein